MYSKEKYCGVCGCLFSLPKTRDPENPDPDEDPLLAYSEPYDARVLPRELTKWLTNFRVIGNRPDLKPPFKNESSDSGLFISAPARWDYDNGAGTPTIPTASGINEEVWVYDNTEGANGMLFPIHEACLNLLQRMCLVRQEQHPLATPKKPTTIKEFCDALQYQRWKNLNNPDKSREEDYYYAKSGGIEWPHDCYGARQFWADEWNTEPGWELLCTDPSPLKIPDLNPYILSQLPQSLSTPSAQDLSHVRIANRLGWLFPEEINMMSEQWKKHRDWEKGVQSLRDKANMISADEGGEDEGRKKLASAPLGLKNRWRIWKMLEGVEVVELECWSSIPGL